MIKRVFTQIEHYDGEVTARIVGYDEAGEAASHENVTPVAGVFDAAPIEESEPADSDAASQAGSGESEAEPEPVKLTGHLPDDFPGKAALEAAGYTTYAKVRALIAKGNHWWADVPDVGKKTAERIEGAV